MKVCDVCMRPGALGHAKLTWEGFVADNPPRGLGTPDELDLCRTDQDLLERGDWIEMGSRHLAALDLMKLPFAAPTS